MERVPFHTLSIAIFISPSDQLPLCFSLIITYHAAAVSFYPPLLVSINNEINVDNLIVNLISYLSINAKQRGYAKKYLF